MADTLQQDSELTHEVLNYLNAQYRGKFASLNALKQLSFAALDKDEIAKTEKDLATINRWLKDLWGGMPILSRAWKEPQTFDSRSALDLLRNIKTDFKKIDNDLGVIFQSEQPFSNLEDVKYTVAIHTRYVYGRDNFLKGLGEFGKNFKQPEMVESSNNFLIQSNLEIQNNASLIKELKSGEIPSADFLARLTQAVFLLPFILRSYVHDINHMLAMYESTFSFIHAEFETSEAQQWESRGISPLIAGYWRANGFAAEEAKDWLSQGVGDFSLACIWRLAGFTATQAIQWLQLGQNAAAASQWVASGYTPETAQPLIAKDMEAKAKEKSKQEKAKEEPPVDEF